MAQSHAAVRGVESTDMGVSKMAPLTDSILDGFLDVCAVEPMDAPAGAWGSKLGPCYSMFDEQMVLGRGAPPSDAQDPLARLLAAEERAGASSGVQATGAGALRSSQRLRPQRRQRRDSEARATEAGRAAALQRGGRAAAVEGAPAAEPTQPEGMPSSALTLLLLVNRLRRLKDALHDSSTGTPSDAQALRAVRPTCHVYTLETSCTESCPICLEGMQCGEVVWRLPCMHQVHEVCASQLFGRRAPKWLCPVCRHELRSGAAL